MNTREAKATELADRGRVVKQVDHWLVFSLTSTEKYKVTLSPLFCSCPDFDTTHEHCKHTMATRITLSRESCDFRTEHKPAEPPIVWPRKTYEQDWPSYEAAQTNEKDEFLLLLHDLCAQIQEKPQRKGRPPVPLADAVYSACLKVFTTLSVRRFMSDLRDAHEKGYISKLPHHNSVSRCLENPEITPILLALIARSSLPLKAMETEFAVDSSGFSSSKFDRWYDIKWGRMVSRHSWVKAHVMSGTTTHVVTSVIIEEKDSADSPQFPPLVKATAENFTINEVSGDKAYAGTNNFQAVEDCGGTAYLAFKTTTTGSTGGIFERMFHLFSLNKEDYLRHYHRRSNVESVFSSVKRKFGDAVRSKTPVAMKNEVLAKLVCHNVSQLIHLMYELGTEVNFESEPELDSKMILKFPY
jgi:transposase